MFKRLTTYLIAIITIISVSVSCTNDNKGFKEYYHSMGNNPVVVVPWLKNIRKSFHGKEARITMYKLDEKTYYLVQLFVPVDDIVITPSSIYAGDPDKEILYFYTEDASAPEQDPVYTNFIENADLINVLWSNERKYSIVEDVQ